MNASGEEGRPQELLIIRRPRGGEDAPSKGGVWKIAYADFMTAMMAFFLVMWLINASDKQTLTQVATYFNPLRLTDKVALSKGMHQSDQVTQSNDKSGGNPKTPSGAKTEAKEKSSAGAKSPASAGKGEAKPKDGKPNEGKPNDGKASEIKAKYNEEALFRDPYGTLDKLAGEAAEDQAHPSRRGEAYRDPFDPAFRRETQAEKRHTARQAASRPITSEGAGQGPTPDAAAGRGPDALLGAAPQATPLPPRQLQGQQAPEQQVLERQAQEQKVQERQAQERQALEQQAQEKQVQQKQAQEQKVQEQQAQQKLAAQKAAGEAAERDVAAKIERDIRDIVARSIAGALPNISVTVTEEGILVSLTDDQNFGMFAIASAEPRPAMVVLMEKLGKVITPYPERLVIRGHTDGRPYKSGTYDNWRLSTARAHMAYYMLVRGGIDEKRVERIEGHADRHLKIADDPEAAQNRRIEILLRKGRS